jgi:GT2 family glycosyltransferase
MKPAKEGLVSIVILNWNGKKDLGKCIKSIWANTSYKDFEVIVSDNGSTDGSVEILESLKKKGRVHKIVLNGKNLGFGGGNNQGIEVAEGEFLILLNNDTEPLKGWLEALVRVARQNPEAGIIGPWFPNADKKDTVFGPGFVDDKGVSRNSFVKEQCFAEMVSGGAFFMRRDVIDSIGLLDEKYFPIYFEDSDYCARARKAGFRVLFTPESKIIHYESSATGRQPGKWMFLALNRNRLRYMLLHFPKRRLAKAGFWELLRFGKNLPSRRGLWLLESCLLNVRDMPEILGKRKQYNSKGFGRVTSKPGFDYGLPKNQENFFLNQEWLGPWLDGVSAMGELPWIVEAKQGGKVIGKAFLSLKGGKAQFLGQDFSYHLDFVAEKGKEKEASEQLVQQLFDIEEKWDLIHFRHLVDKPIFGDVLKRKCEEKKFVLTERQGDACSVVGLPATMEEYYAGLKKKLRKNLRNDLSRLERQFKVETRIIDGFENDKEFEKNWDGFLRLHLENMERKGEKTVLSNPAFRGIYRKASRNAAKKGKTVFLELFLDGRLAGSLLGIKQGDRFSVLNIGFSKDYDARQSLGNVLFLKAINYCCKEGLKKFDLLGGNPEYKAKFGGELKSGLELKVFKSGKDAKMSSVRSGVKAGAKRVLGRGRI